MKHDKPVMFSTPDASLPGQFALPYADAPIGHWRLSLPGWTRVWSSETFRIFGLEPPLPPQGKLDFIFAGDREKLFTCAAKGARENRDWTCEARIIRPSGELRQVLLKGFCERHDRASGELSGVIIDVTELREASRQAQEHAFRYRMLAEHSTDLIIHADLSSKRLYVSPSARTVLGFEPGDLLGLTAFDSLHPDDHDSFRWFQEALPDAQQDRLTTRHRYRHKAGHYIWAEVKYCVVRDPLTSAATGYVAAIRDITERHEAETRVSHLARHDPLTNLPNRRYFEEELSRRLRLHRPAGADFALFWLNLKRFKTVNDSFGHHVGDQVLSVVSRRLKTIVPAGFVARLGGDEFAILHRQSSSEESAGVLARQIAETVREPVDLGHLTVHVSACVGVTIVDHAQKDMEDIFCRADLALCKAKETIDDPICVFREELAHAFRRRLTLENGMKGAIDNGEFYLQYQPIVECPTGQVVACEALLRWTSSDGSLISPAEFIPVAERVGLIVPLGERSLRRACLDAAQWPANFQVAVNVSPYQLMQKSFLSHVSRALDEAAIDPSRLTIEVTESMLVNETETMYVLFRELQKIGTKLSLDDFGTGYSSLSYLYRFPFDKLKIDQSFVRHLDDERTMTIVGSICDLGRKLGKEVIAEGIETQEQLRVLQQLGCTSCQGFYFSRAVSHNAIMSLRQSDLLVA